MIIKSFDSRSEEIDELSSLLRENITNKQRFLIERELKVLMTGIRGEKDSAYYVDFYLGNSENWAVIHDLRIELNDQVAQIDHLLINRFFDIYVLESKNFSYRLTINPEGEFQASYGEQHFGIPSPIEQNRRHIFLLERLLQADGLLPKRLGIPIRPTLRSFVLVSPRAVIKRPPSAIFDTGMVIKADALRSKIEATVDKMNPVRTISTFGKISSFTAVERMARRLVKYHRPIRIDYRAKFGLPAQDILTADDRSPGTREMQKSSAAEQLFCAVCHKALSDKVAKFCLQNAERFKGQALCFTCQKNAAT